MIVETNMAVDLFLSSFQAALLSPPLPPPSIKRTSTLLRPHFPPIPPPTPLLPLSCLGISAGKAISNGFFRATHLRLFPAGFFLHFNAIEGCFYLDYSRPAIQSHKGFRSSSSSANPRMSLSSSMACRSRSLASSMRPVTLA